MSYIFSSLNQKTANKSILSVTISLLVLSSFSFIAHAQPTPSSPTFSVQDNKVTVATMVADVNIIVSTLKLEGNVVSGAVAVKSSMGNQDDVSYGVVVRSKKDNTLLFSSRSFGKVSLPDNKQQVINVQEQLPPVEEDAEVFLNLSNKSGLSLAVARIGEMKGNDKSVCTTDADSIICTSPVNATLTTVVYEGGPQGSIIATTTEQLTKNTPKKIIFRDLVRNRDGGRYVVSVSIYDKNTLVDAVTGEYMHFAPKAKIVNVALVGTTTNNALPYQFTTTVFTQIIGYPTSTPFQVILSSSECGDSVTENLSSASPVTVITFSTTCNSGNAVVTLLSNGEQVDQFTTSFALAEKEITSGNSSQTTLGGMSKLMSRPMWPLFVLLGVGLLVLYGLIRFIQKRKASAVAPLVIVFGVMCFSPTASEAATYAISGGGFTSFCPGSCGGMMDDMNYWPVSGTVTVPGSVAAGQSYVVNITQYMTSDGTGGSSGGSINCLDYVGDSDSCDSDDVRTNLSRGGAVLGSVVHQSSGTVTVTAPSSGPDALIFQMQPYAPYYVGCNPSWLSPAVKCSYGIDPDTFSVNVTVISDPVVNLFFGVIESFVTRAFALEHH